MSVNNAIKEKLKENESEKTYTSSTQTTDASVNTRVFLAVQDIGYRADDNGNVREFVSGYLIDPREKNQANDQPHHARVFLKTAQESAAHSTQNKGSKGGGAMYDRTLAKNNQSFARRPSLRKLMNNVTPNESGGVVMAFDFPHVHDTHHIKDGQNESKVYDISAHWGTPISKRASPDDDRDHKVLMGMGRLGFQPYHNSDTQRDTVYLEMLEDQTTVDLKSIDEPGGKDSRQKVVNFLQKSLNNFDEDAPPEYADTSFRTGFVAVKIGIDETGNGNFKDLPETTMKFYPSLEDKEDASVTDNVTGAVRGIKEPAKPLLTLSELMQLKDKATQDYQQTPQNPDLERRAKEADVMRSVMHVVSNREENNQQLVVAVTNDKKHLENLENYKNAALEGRLQVTMTGGRKYSLFADARDKQAQITRKVYDTKFPDNPSKSPSASSAFVRDSDRHMMQTTVKTDPYTGKKTPLLNEVYAPMAVSTASITENTASPGTYLARMFKTLDPNNIMRGEVTDIKNPDANMIQSYKQEFRLDQGIDNLKPNPFIDKFYEDNPIHKSAPAAQAWYNKHGVATVTDGKTAKTTNRKSAATIDGRIVEDTSELGAGLKRYDGQRRRCK